MDSTGTLEPSRYSLCNFFVISYSPSKQCLVTLAPKVPRSSICNSDHSTRNMAFTQSSKTHPAVAELENDNKSQGKGRLYRNLEFNILAVILKLDNNLLLESLGGPLNKLPKTYRSAA